MNIKAQAIANFLVELTLVERTMKDPEERKIYIDSSVSKKGPWIGVIAIGPCKQKIEHAGHAPIFSNNQQ